MFEITDANGQLATTFEGGRHATDGQRVVTLMEPGRMFRRRAIKKHPDGSASEVSWLVVELNGVRLYVDGNGNAVVTTRDLQP